MDNRISKRGRVNEGRPSKYKREYCQGLLEYFRRVSAPKTHGKTITTKSGTVIEENVQEAIEYPSLAGFAAEIGVCEDTVHEWANAHKEFSAASRRALSFAKSLLVSSGLSGAYDSGFAQFVAINCHGMISKSAVEIMGKDGGNLTIQIVRFSEDDK